MSPRRQQSPAARWVLAILLVLATVAEVRARLPLGYGALDFGRPATRNFCPPRHSPCPLCDASVYSYCSEKLLHDACCCAQRYDQSSLPSQCYYADCSFLHANSCGEHCLITQCCCDRFFHHFKK